MVSKKVVTLLATGTLGVAVALGGVVNSLAGEGEPQREPGIVVSDDRGSEGRASQAPSPAPSVTSSPSVSPSPSVLPQVERDDDHDDDRDDKPSADNKKSDVKKTTAMKRTASSDDDDRKVSRTPK